MSAGIGGFLLVVGCAAVLGGLVLRLYYVIDRRQRQVDAEIDRALEEMDRHVEFDCSPADWPIRESPRLEDRR